MGFVVITLVFSSVFVPSLILSYDERVFNLFLDIFNGCRHRRDYVNTILDICMVFPSQPVVKEKRNLMNLIAEPTTIKEQLREKNASSSVEIFQENMLHRISQSFLVVRPSKKSKKGTSERMINKIGPT